MNVALGMERQLPQLLEKADFEYGNTDSAITLDKVQQMFPPKIDRIKFRAWMLSIVPALILTLTFVIYQAWQTPPELPDQNIQRVKLTTDLLAVASIQGLTAFDKGLLQAQISPLFEASPAIRLLISHISANLQIQLSKKHPNHPSDGSTRQFITNIYTKDNQQIGRLTLEFKASNPILTASSHYFAVAFIGLILVLILSWRLSRGLTDPLEAIVRGVNRVKKGDFSTLIQVNSSGELLSLEIGFNSMAMELDNSRKKVHRTIDRATEDLTKTMEELEIKNVELDLARKRALGASHVKSEFLANMSHEIRTPMHGVLGFTNLLLKSELSSKQRHLVKNISQSANGLLAIINNILDYSKLEYGTTYPIEAPFNLETCCDEAVSMLSTVAHEKGLELALVFFKDVPRMVEGDEVRIRQILLNLLSNAVKFTDTGDVVLQVMVEEETEETYTLLFSLTDTGIGIELEEQSKLFQSFHQADPSARRRFGGTGLGLSICRKLVDSMHGDISMISETNQGSAFFVSLTLRRIHDVADELPPPYTGRKALLISHHPTSTLAISHRLQSLGLVVEEIHGNVTPGQYEHEHAADFIILAAGAKEIASGEAEKEIARWRNEQEIPLLILLGTSEREILEQFETKFNSACYSKPISRESLTSALDKILGENQVAETIVLTSDPREKLFSDKRILIVDDNPINLELVSLLVKEKGAIPTSVDSGMKAILEAENEQYDLIIMDVHMPEVSGTDAAVRIRAGESPGKRVPIIALTADITPETHKNISNSGMDACLIKPLDETKFWDIFADLLEKTQTPDETKHKLAVKSSAATSTLEDDAANLTSLDIRNEDAALRITGDKKELADKMFHQFMSELDEQWKLLEKLYQEKSLHQLSQVAHRLKGGGAICALPSFTHTAELLENASRKADYSGVDKSMKAMKIETERLRSLPLTPLVNKTESNDTLQVS